MERYSSGLRGSAGIRVGRNDAWVRIPLFPQASSGSRYRPPDDSILYGVCSVMVNTAVCDTANVGSIPIRYPKIDG